MPQDGLSLDRIVRLIESGSLSLPVYDPVVLKLQEAIANQTTDISEIERLIISDQALAAEVLKASNSPFFCGLSPVRTIRNAIVRLGTQQVRRLVILASERTKYSAHHPDLHRMLKELWRHASTAALASQWLSKRLRSTGIEEICFLGGLLHDIGKLVILRAVDEIKKNEEVNLQISGKNLKDILQTAHCQIGHRMLQDWNVPEIYCQIARDHHSAEIPSGDLPLAIVRLANEGSRKLGLGLDPDSSLVLAETLEATLLDELTEMLGGHLASAA